MQTAHITADNLAYQADSKTLLFLPELDLKAKRIAIVGRNGSGKTTFARLLSGLIAPTQGTLRVDGHDLFKDRKEAIQTVGILFQNPDHQIIFPTVIEEISFGLRQLGKNKSHARQEALAILSKFSREAWAERSISTLSQGQRHLVCLMAVLAMAPKVIILDEPFAGLDIPTKAALIREFSELEQTLVHITHDTDAIATYDTVIWLESGSVKRIGAPDEVLTEFHTAMAQEVTL